MAISIEFEGWVNEVKPTEWGAFVSVAHSQRAKNAAGEWETVGKDYLDVAVNAELLPAIEGADIVRVVGTLKAGAYVKKDGSAAPSLKVSAKEITPVVRDQRNAPAPSRIDAMGNLANFGAMPVEDAPF